MDPENQSVIYIENWNDLCRLCLRNDQPLQNLFFDATLLENVQEATNLNVSYQLLNVSIKKKLTCFTVYCR